MKEFNEIIIEAKSTKMKFDGFPSKFWVVTKATGKDWEINDIMFETTLEGMHNQYLGGLKPNEILFVTDKKDKAQKFAEKVAQTKGK